MTRPDLLIHWTGKDISTSLGSLTDGDRKGYVDRLEDIVSKGFWMTRPPESLTGKNVRSGSGGHSFKYEVDMTCFTEVRLSASADHAQAYGLLGIAVDRKYVLNRWGTPVHYVRNSDDEWIVGAFADALYQANRLPAGTRDRMMASLRYLGVFLKPMSNSKSDDDFAYIDEHEWRVVQTEEQVRKGRICTTGLKKPQYRLLVEPSDLKLIVFPDEITRRMAVFRLEAFLRKAGNTVPLLTLRECAQF
ncbi:MAG TPA: abortive infection system antitoxin AbiGi family protein [Candidatus Margulisiibacteriota bacterium]|nr:abortive infection system antitoxin AbiGi family protein [Candidatus Margulisiibacteriota bacterium]